VKQLLVLLVSFFLVTGCAESNNRDFGLAPLLQDPASYVDPTIGSGGLYFRYGAAFPGASLPHGMAKPGPDTTGLPV
jgi:putative alpha-1,2-mannosidase